MRDDVKSLKDIVDLIDDIYAAINEFGNDIEDFLSTPIYKAGCTLYLMQIGEYARNLSDDFISKHPAVDWDGLKGLRNIIAHRYEHVDYARLWSMIIDELPTVRENCISYLNEIR